VRLYTILRSKVWNWTQKIKTVTPLFIMFVTVSLKMSYLLFLFWTQILTAKIMMDALHCIMQYKISNQMILQEWSGHFWSRVQVSISKIKMAKHQLIKQNNWQVKVLQIRLQEFFKDKAKKVMLWREALQCTKRRRRRFRKSS